MQKNLSAVLDIIQYMYDTIIYAEMNTKIDCCQVCGYSGEIMIVKDEHGKLVWECPQCRNRDLSKMNVVRRVCGYLGHAEANQGRMAEYNARVIHVS